MEVLPKQGDPMSVWLWWAMSPGFDRQEMDIEEWRKRFQQVPEEFREEVMGQARKFYAEQKKARARHGKNTHD